MLLLLLSAIMAGSGACKGSGKKSGADNSTDTVAIPPVGNSATFDPPIGDSSARLSDSAKKRDSTRK